MHIIAPDDDCASHFHAIFEFLSWIWSRLSYGVILASCSPVCFNQLKLFKKKIPRETAHLILLPELKRIRKYWYPVQQESDGTASLLGRRRFLAGSLLRNTCRHAREVNSNWLCFTCSAYFPVFLLFDPNRPVVTCLRCCSSVSVLTQKSEHIITSYATFIGFNEFTTLIFIFSFDLSWWPWQ